MSRFHLYVFHDPARPMDHRWRELAATGATRVPVEFRSWDRPPDPAAPDDTLLVVSDTGLVYTGDEAWRQLRWALRMEAEEKEPEPVPHDETKYH